MRLPFVLLALGGLAVAQSMPARGPQQLAQDLTGTPVSDATGEPTRTAVGSAAAAMPPRTPRVRFDQPVADGPLWAGADAWKASFDGTGCTVIPFFGSQAPRNFPLRVELAGITVGDDALALPAGTPQRDGERVRTSRGSVDEVIDTSVAGLEQSWVFTTLPSRGAVTVDLRMQGEYAVHAIGDGLRFTNAHGGFDYHGAVAIDADGRRLPLAIGWDGDSAQLTIPAHFVAEAKLPLVLDPFLNGWFLLGSTAPAGQTQHDSDVASIQALGGRTLMVWQRQWSATDADCWGLMFDGNLGLVQTDFTLDFTSDDWLKVACAGNNYAQNFLVVSEVRIGIQHSIFGRVVSNNGSAGGLITIERDGIGGSLPGNNFHPDVGSDPTFAPGRYTIVFAKAFLTSSEIYMRQVATNGSLVTTGPVLVSTGTGPFVTNHRPSISKSCGKAPALQNHMVVWQEANTISESVVFRFVSWNGTPINIPYAAAYGLPFNSRSSASSPINSRDATGNVQYWPLVYEYGAPGQPRTLRCQLLSPIASVSGTFDIGSGIPGADHADPEVDADGTRFVVVYTRSGTQEEQATFAYLPGSPTLRLESRSGLQTSSADTKGQCNIVADFSGGILASPRYFISFTHVTSNSFNLVNFGGYTGGATLFTSRSSNCSNNVPIAVTGSPVIGQSIQVSVNSSSPLAATIFGYPDSISLGMLGCNCLQGVATGGIYGPSSFSWSVPNNLAFVGITLSVQGFELGTECLSLFNMTNIVDFTLR